MALFLLLLLLTLCLFRLVFGDINMLFVNVIGLCAMKKMFNLRLNSLSSLFWCTWLVFVGLVVGVLYVLTPQSSAPWKGGGEEILL